MISSKWMLYAVFIIVAMLCIASLYVIFTKAFPSNVHPSVFRHCNTIECTVSYYYNQFLVTLQTGVRK